MAFLKQQELEEASKKQEKELSNGISESLSTRQVGMKSKREEDEGEDDVEWEEASIGGNTGESYKVNDLNVEAEASEEEEEEEEDDIDWEEG